MRRKDNLRTADGLGVREFLSTMYDDIVESAENIVRGNTRHAADQLPCLAGEMVSLLAEHLLSLPSAPDNVGAYSHRWMLNQARWSRTAFDKWQGVRTFDVRADSPDDEPAEDRCAALDGYLPFVDLNPVEASVYGMMRQGLSAREVADSCGVPQGAFHAVVGAIRAKFADARLDELLEGGEELRLDRLPEPVRKAAMKRNEENGYD